MFGLFMDFIDGVWNLGLATVPPVGMIAAIKACSVVVASLRAGHCSWLLKLYNEGAAPGDLETCLGGCSWPTRHTWIFVLIRLAMIYR